MQQAIVFVSHFRLKEGKLEAFREHASKTAALLDVEKPRTLLFHVYLDEQAERVSIVHAFADREAMDSHVQGAAERSRVAYETLEPESWEVYGEPSDAALSMLRQAAQTAGVSLSMWAIHLSGFTHAPGQR
ncbi:MAG TPA: antibiotic biosynthesis monooxygenase [Candidatus Limnocylindria bacterium]|nr:antibiotic biosynthesis monooxygenase [Candidatus Limnocylindria bacterium]